jgi:hypothetical protein
MLIVCSLYADWYDLGLDQTVYTATAVATQAERHAERRRASSWAANAEAAEAADAPTTALQRSSKTEALEAAYADASEVIESAQHDAPEVIEGPAAAAAEAQAAQHDALGGVKATGVKATDADAIRPPSNIAAAAGRDASPEASRAAPSRAPPSSNGSGGAPSIPPPETARATSPPPLPSRPAPSAAPRVSGARDGAPSAAPRVSGARLGGRAVAGASDGLPSVARLRFTGEKLPFQRLMDAAQPSPATAAAAATGGSTPSGAPGAVAGDLQGSRVKEPLAVTAARRSQPVLDAVQSQLRKQRVYVTTNSGTVLSLRAGADLQVALDALKLRGLPHEAAATTARVNGRTVRREYKLPSMHALTTAPRSPKLGTARVQAAQRRRPDAARHDGAQLLRLGSDR